MEKGNTMRKALLPLYIVLIVCIAGITIKPVIAVHVDISPERTTCACGASKTLTVVTEGIVSDYGQCPCYRIRLVETDFLSYSVLEYVYGTLPKSGDVWPDESDPVAFSIVFKLECDPNCKVLWGAGVLSLKVKLGGQYVEQTQIKTGPFPQAGEYYVEDKLATEEDMEFELSVMIHQPIIDNNYYDDAVWICAPAGTFQYVACGGIVVLVD